MCWYVSWRNRGRSSPVKVARIMTISDDAVMESNRISPVDYSVQYRRYVKRYGYYTVSEKCSLKSGFCKISAVFQLFFFMKK